MLDDVGGRRAADFRAFFAKHAARPHLPDRRRAWSAPPSWSLGIVLIPLPGPGWLIVFAGLAILATEFVWAERLLRFARRKVHGWTEWVTSQSLLVRGLIGLVGLLCVAGAVWAYVACYGAARLGAVPLTAIG